LYPENALIVVIVDRDDWLATASSISGYSTINNQDSTMITCSYFGVA